MAERDRDREPPARSDEDLVRAHLEGDEHAFRELVDRYESAILSMAYRLLGNRSDASDVCQEVFILLLRKIGSFRGEAKFSTWLYRVAMNACHDYSRRSRRHVSLSESYGDDLPEVEQSLPGDDLDSPESSLLKAEVQETVRAALARLPFKFKEVVYLYDIKGYNYKEISEILQVSLGTVKSRLNRARARLAKELEYFREQLL